MRKICRGRNGVIIGAVFNILLFSGRTASGLELVKDGKSCVTIVVAEDATSAHKWAAQQLREYVEKATGAKLDIVPETNAPGGGALISVGHTVLAEKAGLKTDDLQYDGCKLLVKDRVLYLIGRDYIPLKGAAKESAPNPHNGQPQGTIRAVTTFLEDIAGVRWYLPGPEGVFIPAVKDLSVPDAWSKTFTPLLAFLHDSNYDTPIARYANNGRYAINVKLYGGHSWYIHVSAREDSGDNPLINKIGDKSYFKEHPEYFRMDETGKRNPASGHLCTSNPDVRKIMVEKMRKTFDEGYDVIELGQTDGWQPCLCPECQKAYGDGKIPFSADNPAERVWEMHKWIIDELARSHPDKKVLPIIYGPTRFPSKRFDRLPDNAIAEFAGGVAPDDELWKGKFKTCTVYDGYVWHEGCVATCFVPAVDPVWVQQRMRKFREWGVIGLSLTWCGLSWGLGGPTFYADAKLAGDPDVNIDKLVAEYCHGVYGEAGPIMERFYRLFHSRSGKTLEGLLCVNRLQFENSYPAEDAFCAFYPPAIVGQLDRLLRKAEETGKTERAKGWLKHTRDDFDGLKTIAEMFAAKRAYELQPTKAMLLLLKEKVDAFEDWRSRILAYSKDPEYVKRWFPAYPRMCNFLISGGSLKKWESYYYRPDLVLKEVEAIVKGEKSVRGKGVGSSLGHHEITAPITWDFEKMLANIGHSKEEKRIQVRRTTAKPGADGALDPAAWANVPALSFEVYKSANSRLDENSSTAVRLLYDDERLYVRYECREPNIDKLKLKSVGRDGNVYYLDEVELFLNPECSSRKMMHFMAAPVKDAMYDERKGYIEDPVDPRYSASDIAWNADWTYTYAIDKENKRWVLEMAVPFKSLGVKTPQEGNVWTVNFARARRAGDFEELSCWIAEDFGNPEVFGELVFGDKAEKSAGGTTP